MKISTPSFYPGYDFFVAFPRELGNVQGDFRRRGHGLATTFIKFSLTAIFDAAAGQRLIARSVFINSVAIKRALFFYLSVINQRIS